MGRGRAKAKQAKVARRLKYQTMDTDFDALQRELAGSKSSDEYDEYDPDEYDPGDADVDSDQRARKWG